jgi:aminopeptidase N
VQQEKMGRYLDEAQSKREPLIRYHYASHEDMFDRHSYDKGGRVLHMLRKYVGDDAFFTALNRYLTQNKFSTSEIAKLRIVFEEVTGEDLMWFFDQWFLQRGHPELKVTHSFANGQVSLRVQQLQDSTFSPIYRLPVTVTTWVNNQATDHQIVVTKADQTFRLNSSQRPNLVKFDSEAQLLAQIEEERSQDELLFQFSHARNYLQKYEAIDLLRPKNSDLAVSGMLRNALSDNFWAVRLAAVQALRRYKGAEGNAVRKELQRVASTDKKSQVRAVALTTLSAFINENYSANYTAALSDSSYHVVSAAIQALAKIPAADSRDRITALQETTSHEVLSALSAYYALNGSSTEQYQWFLRRLPDVSKVDLYQAYLPNFATFMLRIPPVERDKGIQRLESLARTDPNDYVRLGAYKGLSILSSNMPTLKATMQDIRNKEKDEQVKAYYALMQ